MLVKSHIAILTPISASQLVVVEEVSGTLEHNGKYQASIMGHLLVDLANCRIRGIFDTLIHIDLVELQIAIIVAISMLLLAKLARGTRARPVLTLGDEG